MNIADQADQGDADRYLSQARAMARDVPVEALNAKDPAAVDCLTRWLGKGRTGALLGSSGVGKTTLLNALTALGEATGDIREDDARGRHTTTARGLFAAKGGSWLVDTPGMRAVRLSDVSDGIDVVFSGFCRSGSSVQIYRLRPRVRTGLRGAGSHCQRRDWRRSVRTVAKAGPAKKNTTAPAFRIAATGTDRCKNSIVAGKARRQHKEGR